MDQSGGFYHPEDGNEPTPGSLNDSENSFNSNNLETNPPDRKGLYRQEGSKKGTADNNKSISSSGVQAVAGSTPIGKALAAVKKHKKGAAVGVGGITSAIIIMTVLFGFLITNIVNTIEKDLLHYEAAAVQGVEHQASDHILKALVCRKVSGAAAAALRCRKLRQAEGDKNPQSEDPMAKEIDDFSFTKNPELVDALEKQGFKVELTDGNFDGLTDTSSGAKLTTSDLSDPEISARLQAATHELDIGQEATFRSLLVDHANANFDVVRSPEDNAEKDVDESVSGTTDNTTQLEEAASENSDTTDAQPTQTQIKESAAASSTSPGNSEIINEANAAEQAGASEEGVIKSVIKKHLGRTLLISTAIADVCSVQSAAQKASNGRVPKIIGFLVRHGTTLISLADEIKTGAINGQQFKQIMAVFTGNPADNPSPSNKDLTSREAALPFDRSAAWLRMTNQSSSIDTNVNSSSWTPDINKSSLPQASSGTKIFNKINGIFHTFGGSIACKVNGNIFGQIALSALSVYALASGAIDFGASDVAVAAGIESIQLAIQHIVIPAIVRYFTPAGMNGRESSVEWMNNADAGTNLSYNMYAQRMGGKPLSGGQAVALYRQGVQQQQYAESTKSFYQRTLAFSNPQSLVSRVAVTLPLTKLALVNSALGSIFNAPMSLYTNLGEIIGGKALAATSSTTYPGEAYGITQYGFDPSEINAYDPIANEQFLYTTTVTAPNGHSGKLVDLFGSPTQYPHATDDNSTTDLLHCFSQSYQKTASEKSPDSICATMGNFDSSSLTPTPMDHTNVANSLCDQLDPGDNKCVPYMENNYPLDQYMNRFRQYILDSEVVSNYASLGSAT